MFVSANLDEIFFLQEFTQNLYCQSVFWFKGITILK